MAYSYMIAQSRVLDRARLFNESMSAFSLLIAIVPQSISGGMLVLWHTQTCTVLDELHFEYKDVQTLREHIDRMQAQYAQQAKCQLAG